MPAQLSSEAAAVVRVRIPSPLRSYTGRAEADVAVPVLAPELPPTLGGVLAALNSTYPGIRFRIVDEQGQVRRHIKLFVGATLARDLSQPIPAGLRRDDRRGAVRRLSRVVRTALHHRFAAAPRNRVKSIGLLRSSRGWR